MSVCGLGGLHSLFIVPWLRSSETKPSSHEIPNLDILECNSFYHCYCLYIYDSLCQVQEIPTFRRQALICLSKMTRTCQLLQTTRLPVAFMVVLKIFTTSQFGTPTPRRKRLFGWLTATNPSMERAPEFLFCEMVTLSWQMSWQTRHVDLKK